MWWSPSLASLNGLFPPEGPSQLCAGGEKPSELGWHVALITHSGHGTYWGSRGEGEAGELLSGAVREPLWV